MQMSRICYNAHHVARALRPVIFMSKGFPVLQQGGTPRMWKGLGHDIWLHRAHRRLQHWDQFWGWKHNPAVTSWWQESIWLKRSTRSPQLEAHVVLQPSSTSHVLQSLLSQSPPLNPALQVKSCLGKACPPLLSYCRCGDGTPTFTPFTQVPSGLALQQNMQKSIFPYSGIFWKSVALHQNDMKLGVISTR